MVEMNKKWCFMRLGEVTRETRPLTTISILAPSHLGFFTKGLTYVFASKLEIFSPFEFGKNESKRRFHKVLEK